MELIVKFDFFFWAIFKRPQALIDLCQLIRGFYQ